MSSAPPASRQYLQCAPTGGSEISKLLQSPLPESRYVLHTVVVSAAYHYTGLERAVKFLVSWIHEDGVQSAKQSSNQKTPVYESPVGQAVRNIGKPANDVYRRESCGDLLDGMERG